MRTSRDVDFYVFKKDWARAKSLLEKDVTMTDNHSGQHWEFTKDGIPFEMHYHTAVFASGSRQRYWDELIDSYFDDILDHVEINVVLGYQHCLQRSMPSICLFISTTTS